MNRLLLGMVLLIVNPLAVHADEFIPWLSADGKKNVVIHPAGQLTEKSVVQVTGDAMPTVTRILEIDQPKLFSHKYVLRGRIKYEKVEGEGFVEMLNTFAGPGSYFTRTVDQAGPLGKLAGSSDWREIELPFLSEPGLLPSKITVSVHLPGKGIVYLEALSLSAYEMNAATAWWSEQQSSWVGGLGGSMIGVLGAVVGVVAGLGMARRFVLSLCWAVTCLGVVLLVAAMIAVLTRQPHHVYFPLFLLGGVSALVFGLNLPGVKRRFDEIELRRMSALDA